jgi:subtilisin family serine protease
MITIKAYVALLPYFLLTCGVFPFSHDRRNDGEIIFQRKARGRQHSVRKGGKKVSGTYIVRLADDTTSFYVKGLAAKHASKMRDIIKKSIASGQLMQSNITQVVKRGHIFTSSIKGFTLTGIPDELALSLVNMTGVISVEQDEFFSGVDQWHESSIESLSMYRNQIASSHAGRALWETDTQGNSSCPQMVPWGVKRVGGPILSNPNPNGKVFIIDTGISPVADLNIDKNLSIDFVNDGGSSPAWNDRNGHGTHVAGTVAAMDNCMDVVGVVPGATVVAVRVLDSSGGGTWSAVLKGIDYVAATAKKGDVANLSFTGPISESADSAVINAAKQGIKFALAAGNYDDDSNNYSPARLSTENVYTVSAFDPYEYLCSWSNYGNPPITYSGPGEDIWSLNYQGGIEMRSGTSMASPHIAGLLLAGNIAVDGYIRGDKDSVPDAIACWK